MNLERYLITFDNLQSIVREMVDEAVDEAVSKAMEKVKTEDAPEGLLSSAEVRKMFGISKQTLWRWKEVGYLLTIKVGTRNYYNKSDVERISKKSV